MEEKNELRAEQHFAERTDFSLRQAQQIVDVWVRQHGGYWSPLSILAQIAEETGEIARLVNYMRGQKPQKENEIVWELGIELCDLLYAVICLANVEGIDLQESFEAMLEKYTLRDKERFEADRETTEPSGNV